MPIRFRCTHCQQLLSVSRKQSGATTACPACGGDLRVPIVEGFGPAAAKPEESRAREQQEVLADAEERARDEARGDSETAAVGAGVVPGTDVENRRPWEQDTRNVWESELGDWEEHPAFHNAPRRSIKDEADMTSMVDVTFLLLVFFMITASFSVTKALQTSAPTNEEGAASSAAAPMTMDELAAESVVVEIGADDTIRVDDVPVAGPVELGQVLQAKVGNEHKNEMVIEAAYRATHGMVVAVTDAGMQAGMQRVRRVSRPERP